MEASAIFKNLAYWAERESAWPQLITGDTLFRAVEDLVNKKELPDEALTWIQECDEFIQDSQTERHWNFAYTLVWCAQEVTTNYDYYRQKIGSDQKLTEIDRLLMSMGKMGESVQESERQEQEKFAWDCIRAFCGKSVRRTPVNIPVALIENETNLGFIATLSLEVLDPGAGQTLHHPCDVFTASFRTDFMSSMEGAWKSAQSLAQREDITTLFDGRWRLLKDGCALSQSVGGRSASGAAAYGWWFALTGKVPDSELSVIAQVDEEEMGLLIGFDGEGIPEKTTAIIEAGCFDTIVVADPKDKAKAEEVLDDKHIPPSQIRVGLPAELITHVTQSQAIR